MHDLNSLAENTVWRNGYNHSIFYFINILKSKLDSMITDSHRQPDSHINPRSLLLKVLSDLYFIACNMAQSKCWTCWRSLIIISTNFNPWNPIKNITAQHDFINLAKQLKMWVKRGFILSHSSCVCFAWIYFLMTEKAWFPITYIIWL